MILANLYREIFTQCSEQFELDVIIPENGLLVSLSIGTSVKTIALVKNVIEGKMEQKEKPPVVTEAKMLITFSQCEFWLHDKKDVANARSADQT